MTSLKGQDWEHQSKAFEISKDEPDFGLFMDVGTGKTRVIFRNALYLFEQGKIDTLLIEAPNNVHRNWLDEFPLHMPDDLPRAMAYYESGANARHSANFESVMRFNRGLRVLSYNIESLSNLETYKRYHLEALKNRPKTMIVIDESSKIKTPGSKRTKNAYKLGDIAAYRRILTGTPVSSGLENLFSQFRFLNWKILGCRTYAEFCARYCEREGEYGEITSYRNQDDLLRKISPFIFQADKKLLNLPPEIWQTRYVELSPEQKRLYKDLKKQFIAELDSHTLTAIQAGVRIMRLRQILSGYFPTDEKELLDIPCPRLEACGDLVEEACNGKIIIWCHFQEDIVRVCRMLEKRGIGSVPYFGRLNADTRYSNLQSWRSKKYIIALVATPATGGIGLTMNEADTDITYSHNYSYEEWRQKCARNHRGGQTKPVTHYDLVARGTADVRMMQRVREQGELADLVRNLQFGSLKNLFSEDEF